MTFHSLSPNEASQARQISTVAKHGPKGKKKDEERGDRKTDQLLTKEVMDHQLFRMDDGVIGYS